jgi:WD40 repeat protein
VDDFYSKLSLKKNNIQGGNDNSIVSVEFAFLKSERLHLLVVGLKKGTICLMKKSISNVTDSVYQYDFYKKKHSIQKFIKSQRNIELQKITCLNQYLFCGLTSGVIHIINIQEDEDTLLSSFIAHQGNITSLDTFFIGNYLLTSSGSFNRNHDNSICVFHITNLSKRIYIKEKIQIKEAHGSIKGVIVCKALVHKGNELVFSAGGSDDQTLRIWNLLTGQCLFEFIYQEPIYDLNILIFSKNEQMKLSKEDVSF